MIDLLTVLTLYVCATFMICIISLFLHCPHFGRRVYCTFTHHIGKNDISYDAPILWIWRTIYESVYICISRYVCLFKDVLKTLWFLSCHRKVLHIYPFTSFFFRKVLAQCFPNFDLWKLLFEIWITCTCTLRLLSSTYPWTMPNLLTTDCLFMILPW